MNTLFHGIPILERVCMKLLVHNQKIQSKNVNYKERLIKQKESINSNSSTDSNLSAVKPVNVLCCFLHKI